MCIRVRYDASNTTAGGNQALNAPALVEVFENHVFLAGHAATGAAVAFSKPNDAYTWTAAAGAGQLTAGFDCVQIKPFRDNLFLFGSNNIKKVVVSSAGAFSLENVTANVGCVAPDSVQEIGGALLFLAPDGFMPVAGPSRIGDTEIQKVRRAIQSNIVDPS